MEAVRTDTRVLIENKSKFIIIHASSGHKQALQEVLSDPAIQVRLADTKYAREMRALDLFFSMLNNDPDRAYYGWDHVCKASEIGAVGTLLITDALFRYTLVLCLMEGRRISRRVKSISCWWRL
jgi:protein pelota